MLSRQCRERAAGGTFDLSLLFEVVAMAYVSAAEVRALGGAEAAIEDFTDGEILTHAAAIEDEADGFLRSRYSVPLDPLYIPLALKRHMARATFFSLIASRGFSPEGGDQMIIDGYADFKAYLKGVSQGLISIEVPGGVSATATHIDGPRVYSEELRERTRWGSDGGWDDF